MRIVRASVAGTLESSDALVRISPQDGLKVSIRSTVMGQYGRQIREVVDELLGRLEITDAEVEVDDKGAFDFTLRARLQAACFRASDVKPDWTTL